MRRDPRLLPLVVLLAALAGCSSAIRPEVVQAWVGRPAVALEKEWGPPTREVKDGDLRLLIYEEIRKETDFQSRPYSRVAPYAQALADATANPITLYGRSYLFWVDPAGQVVRATVREP